MVSPKDQVSDVPPPVSCGASERRTLYSAMLVSYAGSDGRACHDANRSVIAWRDPVTHAQRRIPWSRGLNTAALKDYEPTISDRVAQLVDAVLGRGGEGEAVDLTMCIRRFA